MSSLHSVAHIDIESFTLIGDEAEDDSAIRVVGYGFGLQVEFVCDQFH